MEIFKDLPTAPGASGNKKVLVPRPQNSLLQAKQWQQAVQSVNPTPLLNNSPLVVPEKEPAVGFGLVDMVHSGS